MKTFSLFHWRRPPLFPVRSRCKNSWRHNHGSPLTLPASASAPEHDDVLKASPHLCTSSSPRDKFPTIKPPTNFSTERFTMPPAPSTRLPHPTCHPAPWLSCQRVGGNTPPPRSNPAPVARAMACAGSHAACARRCVGFISASVRAGKACVCTEMAYDVEFASAAA